MTLSLEPRTLAAGDFAELTLEARGGMFSQVRFRPQFELENFEVVGGPRRSEGVSIVNGVAARSFALSWRLRAVAEGQAAVRDVVADFGEEQISLPDARATIRAAPPDTGPPAGRGRRGLRAPADPVVFLRAEATPAHPWTGQQVLYSLWIYTQVQVASMSLQEAPTFSGFWVEEVPVPDDADGEAVEVDGELFLRKLLLRRALFPLRPGRFEVSPAELNLMVNSPSRDPFRPFFSRSERLVRKSNPVLVDARPLPPPPAGFRGVVGDVAVAARLAPSELAVGEAATLDVELTGRGHLQGAPAPEISSPRGIKVLPPEEGGGREVAGTTVEGSRRWSFAVVPESSGVFRLGPVAVPYFDPEAGEYRVAASGPLLLRARSVGAEATGGAGPTLHPIRSAALPAEGDGRWRPLLPWLFALPWGVVLLVSVARRRRGRLAARDAGGTGARQRFHDRLERAEVETRPRPAAAEIEGAWRDLLAERWRLDPAVPTSHWRERLVDAGAAAGAATSLATLIDDLHYLRFAPQLSTIDALRRELITRSRDLEPKLR